MWSTNRTLCIKQAFIVFSLFHPRLKNQDVDTENFPSPSVGGKGAALNRLLGLLALLLDIVPSFFFTLGEVLWCVTMAIRYCFSYWKQLINISKAQISDELKRRRYWCRGRREEEVFQNISSIHQNGRR